MTADVDLTIAEDVWTRELLPDRLEGGTPGLVALTVELTVVGRAFLTDEPSSFWVVLTSTPLELGLVSWPKDFGFLGSLLCITRCGLC